MEIEVARQVEQYLLDAGQVLAQKNQAIVENRADLTAHLLEASHKTRIIWSECLEAIHATFSESPYKTRTVIIFAAKKTQHSPSKEDVQAAAKLLRHPALGWDVRFSAKKDGSELRIIYRHKSLIED